MTKRWRSIAAVAAPEWRRLTAASLLAAGTVATSLALMGSSAWLITRAAFHPSIAELQVAIVGVRAFGLARGIARYAERLLTHEVALRLLQRLRLDLFGRLTAPPIGPRLALSSGDRLGRVMADLDTLEHAYTRVGGPAVTALVAGLGLVAAIAAIHRPAAVLVAAGLLIGGVVVPAWAWRRSRACHHAIVRRRARLQELAVDGLQGTADLVVMGAAGRFAAEVEATVEALAADERRLAWLAATGPAGSALAVDVMTAAVVALGAGAVASGGLAPVRFAVLVLLAAASGEIIALLPPASQALSSTEAAAARIWPDDPDPSLPVEVSEHTAVPDVERAAPPSPSTAGANRTGLAIRNLSFTYPGAALPSLRDVTLDIPRGRLVAIVGDSGAGKSTLVQVLLRFWPVAAHMVRLEGLPLEAWPEAALRRHLSWMGQRAHIITGTLWENLTLASPACSREAAWAALDAVGLGEAVRAWPGSLETWIGELGATLSGGERQRLALARVLLADSPVVLLDEPTSQVDAETERVILATVRGLAATRAVVLVTHRLTGLGIADEIVVLQDGRVVERGDFVTLAARPGGSFRARLRREQDLDDPVAPAPGPSAQE